MIKVVGFDLDETLYKRDDSYILTIDDMNIRLNQHVRYQDHVELFDRISLEEYYAFSSGHQSREDYRNGRVSKFYQALEIDVTKEDVAYFNERLNFHRQHITLRPNMKSALCYLKEKQIPIFLLTNGPTKDQRAKIQQLALCDYFDADKIFISEEMGCRKPQLTVFQFVQNHYHVKPEEIAYVGDHYYNDIIGCEKAGWHGLYYNITAKESHSHEIAEHDDVITGLQQL